MCYKSMNRIMSSMLVFVGAMFCAVHSDGAEPPTAASRQTDIPLTLVKESRKSIERGVKFLLERQQENGSWLDEAAVTGLVCMAIDRSGTERYAEKRKDAVERGRKYILSKAQPDGSIAGSKSKYVNYSTAICLEALAVLGNREDHDVMRKARHFLLDLQLDEDHPKRPTAKDNPYYGGIGYGSDGPMRPDLSNTQTTLEALHVTRYLDTEQAGADKAYIRKSELCWEKALNFLEDVQDIPKSADSKWVATKLEDSALYDGGFYYQPNESKATNKLLEKDERVEGGLRSYGSMTYAGLKSMIYADVDKDDPRVQAATHWIRNNYDLETNPGMGPEGYYYYLHTFAKSLAALGKETITTPEGKTRYWRIDLIKQLLGKQRGEGQWGNERSGRWMESIPELVTAYALMSMETALGEHVSG